MTKKVYKPSAMLRANQERARKHYVRQVSMTSKAEDKHHKSRHNLPLKELLKDT